VRLPDPLHIKPHACKSNIRILQVALHPHPPDIIGLQLLGGLEVGPASTLALQQRPPPRTRWLKVLYRCLPSAGACSGGRPC
jgi:hypothetical protein